MSATVNEGSDTALDPVYRASEVIFGLLMAMSFIGSISVATDGREEVRTLLIAALGCNLAWGLVDAVMHLVATKTQKRRTFVLLEKLIGGEDAVEGRTLLADEMPAPLAASALPNRPVAQLAPVSVAVTLAGDESAVVVPPFSLKP